MKKPIYALLIMIMLALAACNGQTPSLPASSDQAAPPAAEKSNSAVENAAPASSMEQNAPAEGGLNADFENAEPIGTQILIGILKLDGTDLALTKEQATSMLPLFDEYLTLTRSMAPSGGKQGDKPNSQSDDTQTAAAPGENTETRAQIDALLAKIQAVLSADQIKAIAGMKISRDIAMTIMQEKGINNGGPRQGDGNSARDTGPVDGQKPADGQQPPSDGKPEQAGGEGSASQPAGGRRPGGGMIQPGLMSAVIKILENLSGLKSTSEISSAGLNPAEAFPGGPGGHKPSDDSGSTPLVYAAVYQQKGGTEVKTGETIIASESDQSAVVVSDSGKLTLTDTTINSSGDTSSQDNSSFHGLNAAVLATSGSSIDFSDSTVKTTGLGANGVFATGTGSTVNLTIIVIDATGDGGHGVMATNGGVITLKDVDITTAGKNSGVLATDRDSGTITAEGGTILASGVDSPAIYSTGNISGVNGSYSATGAESAVIEGANSITLTNSILTSSKENKWGVMIYQSMSGDAEGTQGTFTMAGGELANTARTGPLFYVTNSTGIINLDSVSVTANSGELVNASAGKWGNTGSNGGNVIFTADGQSLTGSITADSISTISLTLQNGSTYKGAINAEKTARQIDLSLDDSSTWNVTGDSYLTCLQDSAGISGSTITNINGYGFNVYYDSANCPSLGGKTYALNEGGSLAPLK